MKWVLYLEMNNDNSKLFLVFAHFLRGIAVVLSKSTLLIVFTNDVKL